MIYKDIRHFIEDLIKKRLLYIIKEPVSTILEITEIQNKLIAQNGPAVLFENVYTEYGKSSIPVLANLFGSTERIALALGYDNINQLRTLGTKLAYLKNPNPPTGFRNALDALPLLKSFLNMRPSVVNHGKCHEKIYIGDEVDLKNFPIQTCWPNEPAPLITWGMVITSRAQPGGSSTNTSNASFHSSTESVEINVENNVVHKNYYNHKLLDYNAGIYRMQVIDKNRLIVRWLKHRGGADHHRIWFDEYGADKMPVAVVIGADPCTILSAVMPIPENMQEYNFSGLLRKERIKLVKCKTIPIHVPENAEIVLEGFISKGDYSEEGPYGDHTGFYNSVEAFPVLQLTAITTRSNPIYLTTYTGKPPDEPSILGEALNEIFIPILQVQFPEIIDFWLPPEGCSYRIAVVSIKKSYPGHAKRIMMGVWSCLRQFMYTKFIIVVDHNINIRSWPDVMWAISTQMDFGRDTMLLENTPIDYLDFASIKSELGTKMGFDATKKIYPETEREWGKEIKMDKNIIENVKSKWSKYGFDFSYKI